MTNDSLMTKMPNDKLTKNQVSKGKILSWALLANIRPGWKGMLAKTLYLILANHKVQT